MVINEQANVCAIIVESTVECYLPKFQTNVLFDLVQHPISKCGKGKHTVENFATRKTFTYSLIPLEKIVNGFIYLYQTESKEATKIGWTTKPSELRKSGLQR